MTDNQLLNLPAELRDRRQWVGARIFPNPKQPGKTEKVPVNPHTGENASSTDPATWGTFAEACQCQRRYSLQGIGYVFAADDPYCGVDFDHVIDDGKIEQWALDYVRQLNSYTERSQSGTGLHIIVRAELPPYGRKKGPVEMYTAGRFFVCTGDVLDGYTTIRDAQEAVNLLHSETFGEAQPAPQPVTRTAQAPGTLADAELLAKLRACKGGKYAALLDGNLTGYPSQSEADLALCHGLAFYAGGDPGTVDRLFRQSALYRDKWDIRHHRDGATYGARTIDTALASMTDFYDGNGREPAERRAVPDEPEWMDATEPPALDDDALAAQLASTPHTDEPKRRGASWADMAGLIGPIAWEWQDWLPAGLLVELVADSGVGKSVLALRIAASYLMGWMWPDGTPFTGTPGKVLWVEAEAGQALNLERAQAWGLPICNIVSPFQNPLDDASLFDAAHLAAIAAEAAYPDVRLIVVDSLSGGTAGREKGEDQMPVVKWLAELARNVDKPVMLLHHLRKRGLADGGDVVTLDRVRGSTVIVQPARVVWALDIPNANTLDHKRLSVIKSNLGRFPKSIGMRIDDGGVVFDEAPTVPKTMTKLDQAKLLLLRLLAGGPRLQTEVEAEAVNEGISMDTMREAKKKLGCRVSKDGHTGKWSWDLPDLAGQDGGQDRDDV